MIYPATKAIQAAIQAQGWSCQLDEQGNTSAVITGFNLQCGGTIQIFFLSNSEGNDASIRVFRLLPIPAGKGEAALRRCNEMNEKFRFVKFVAGQEAVEVMLDIPAETQDVGKVAIELLTRLLNICEQALPDFRQALA